MVVHDSEFKVDLTRLNDKELKERRHRFVGGLFNGYKGSPDHDEKSALIVEIDVEREMRFKKLAERRSNIAILISVISVAIAGMALLI